MSERNDQLMARVEALASQVRVVDQAEEDVSRVAAELKSKKDFLKESQEKLKRLAKDISDIQYGQGLLPYEDHPDVKGGTPALNLVGKKLAEAELSKKKSLNSELSILVGYGISGGVIETIADALKVKTVRDLCQAMQKGDDWYKDVKGLGGKRRLKVEEAVQKLLDDGAAKNDADAKEPPDNRMKKCRKCGEFRDQSIEKCAACKCSTFDLENPPADASGESVIQQDDVATVDVPVEVALTVHLHAACHPDTGLWHSSFSAFNGDDQLIAGRLVPHHNSEQFGNKEEALQAACVAASGKLIEMEHDSAAASVREWAQNRLAATSDDPQGSTAAEEDLEKDPVAE